MMETKTTEGLMSCKCELVKDELEKLSPEHEKAGESDTQSSTVQAELQRREVVPDLGEKAVPDLGEKGTIMQMETGVSVCGTVEMDSVGHGAVFETCTAKITPSPSEAMETCISEKEGDQHPVERDSTGLEVVPNSRTTEITPKAKEEMESSLCEQNGDQHTDAMKNAVEKDVLSPLLGGGGSLALLSAQYRDESSDDLSESDSDSSSSTSSSSSSSSSEPVIVKKVCGQDEDEEAAAPGKKTATLRTQDELLIEDLPAVENLTIGLPEGTDMEPVGIISSIVDQLGSYLSVCLSMYIYLFLQRTYGCHGYSVCDPLTSSTRDQSKLYERGRYLQISYLFHFLVIVESKRDTQPLNEDSILFSKGRVSIGRVFEVFGPVCQPYYILRFNSQEDIEQKDLKIRDPVYFAPKIKDFTEYIFVEKIKLAKGSDASWKNDQEPPPEALDFSDDEEERMVKQKLKAQRRPQQQKHEESDSDSESSASRPPPPPRRKPRQNRNPQRGRPAHQEHHGGFHANYHTNPHFQQDFVHHPPVMHHPPDPYRPPFQGRGYPPPYPQPPSPHMGINLWHPCPYPGPMFYPPPPPPPPPAPPSI